jgi:hypothetical protein
MSGQLAHRIDIGDCVPAANPARCMSSIIRIRNGDIRALPWVMAAGPRWPEPSERIPYSVSSAAPKLPSAKPSVQPLSSLKPRRDRPTAFTESRITAFTLGGTVPCVR